MTLEETQKLQREWAKKLGLEVEMTSPSGIVMVVIPPRGEALPKPYLLGKYEVTQGEWEAVMGSNPSLFQKSRKEVVGMDTSRFPVERVSWYDSVEFCNKLSEKEGLKPYYSLDVTKRNANKQIEEAKVTIVGGTGYHIPTDAEWEHGCRAGSKTKYHFGDNDEELPEYAWFLKNSGMRTHKVGELKPNAFGLHDMHGNVHEWNEEMLSHGTTGAPERVIRGGYWHHPASICAVISRYRWAPTSSHNINGLRLARFP
jgi:formylglycine-generating enzyme required for sulfatase activity